MKLWKIIQEGGYQVWRSIPVPEEVECREDILDVLGLSGLENTELYIHPTGFCHGGHSEYDITVLVGRSAVLYVFTY